MPQCNDVQVYPGCSLTNVASMKITTTLPSKIGTSAFSGENVGVRDESNYPTSTAAEPPDWTIKTISGEFGSTLTLPKAHIAPESRSPDFHQFSGATVSVKECTILSAPMFRSTQMHKDMFR